MGLDDVEDEAVGLADDACVWSCVVDIDVDGEDGVDGDD